MGILIVSGLQHVVYQGLVLFLTCVLLQEHEFVERHEYSLTCVLFQEHEFVERHEYFLDLWAKDTKEFDASPRGAAKRAQWVCASQPHRSMS